MPNHYAVTITGYADYDKWDVAKFNDAHECREGQTLLSFNLCEMVVPMPPELREEAAGEAWYDWAVNNWGTKWGTYDTKAHDIKGDGCPVLITFCCAWGPPKKHILRLILNWLGTQWGLERAMVLGLNPGDDSINILTFWEVSP